MWLSPYRIPRRRRSHRRFSRADARLPDCRPRCPPSARLSPPIHMPVITATPTPTLSRTEISEKTLLAGLALTSFAALLLELALTRLFSVVLFYHFAFLAISIALLGLGAGGVFAYLLKNRLARTETRTLAARLCIDSSIVVLFVLEVVLHVPVTLTVSGRNFLHLTAIYISAALPFFLTGVQFSVVFARESRRIPRLYEIGRA